MKQLKILFLVLIGVLVSTTFTSCGSDDEPNMPSEDELYQQWLEDATAQYDVVKDGMAYYIQEGSARLMSVNPAISGAVTIPSEVYYEGTGKSYPVTFFNCKSLKEITLPKTLRYIYYGCCEGCSSLSNVHILSTTPPSLRDANYGMPFTVMDNLYVPKGCKEAYKEVYPWSEFKEIIEE